jgi:hypothetical protein
VKGFSGSGRPLLWRFKSASLAACVAVNAAAAAVLYRVGSPYQVCVFPSTTIDCPNLSPAYSVLVVIRCRTAPSPCLCHPSTTCLSVPGALPLELLLSGNPELVKMLLMPSVSVWTSQATGLPVLMPGTHLLPVEAATPAGSYRGLLLIHWLMTYGKPACPHKQQNMLQAVAFGLKLLLLLMRIASSLCFGQPELLGCSWPSGNGLATNCSPSCSLTHLARPVAQLCSHLWLLPFCQQNHARPMGGALWRYSTQEEGCTDHSFIQTLKIRPTHNLALGTYQKVAQALPTSGQAALGWVLCWDLLVIRTRTYMLQAQQPTPHRQQDTHNTSHGGESPPW